MAFLTRDAILKAADIKSEEVAVPEWGGTVLVRGMTGRERDAFESSMVEERKGKRRMNMRDFRARFCAYCIIDADNRRLFSDSDVESLGNKSAAALQRVYDVAARLSGMSTEDEAELLGESEDDPSGVSGSA